MSGSPLDSPATAAPVDARCSVPRTESPASRCVQSIPRRLARTLSLKERLILWGTTAAHTCFGCRDRDCFGILMYHRVTDNFPDIPEPTWNVETQRFEQ